MASRLGIHERERYLLPLGFLPASADKRPLQLETETMIDWKSGLGRKARKLLDSEYVIWLTTVGKDGTPQPRPVWFIPYNDDVLIYSQPKTSKVAHIPRQPRVSLHFNTDREAGETVVVLTGMAGLEDGPPANENAAYIKKYKAGIADLDMTPEKFTLEYAQPIRVVITNVRGW
jgi:PPOX class probable F420-dependent enzyme